MLGVKFQLWTQVAVDKSKQTHTYTHNTRVPRPSAQPPTPATDTLASAKCITLLEAICLFQTCDIKATAAYRLISAHPLKRSAAPKELPSTPYATFN